MVDMEFTSVRKDGVVLIDLYVQPKSSRNKMLCLHDKAVKLAITAPPVDGKANKAVGVFLAAFFNLSKSSVQIHSGHQSRKKRFALIGLSEEEVKKRVLEAIEE